MMTDVLMLINELCKGLALCMPLVLSFYLGRWLGICRGFDEGRASFKAQEAKERREAPVRCNKCQRLTEIEELESLYRM